MSIKVVYNDTNVMQIHLHKFNFNLNLEHVLQKGRNIRVYNSEMGKSSILRISEFALNFFGKSLFEIREVNIRKEARQVVLTIEKI